MSLISMIKRIPMRNSHDELISSLPWLVNGSLSPEKSAKLQNHIDQCETCQLEVEALTKLQTLQNRRAETVSDAQASLQRMRLRINESEKNPVAAAPLPWWTWPLNIVRQLTGDGVRLPSLPTHSATAAAVLLLATLLILQSDQMIDRSTSDYSVLSSGSATQTGIDLYVRFHPSLTAQEVDQLLADSSMGNEILFTWSQLDSGEYKLSVTESLEGSSTSLTDLSEWVEELKSRTEVLDVGLLPNQP